VTIGLDGTLGREPEFGKLCHMHIWQETGDGRVHRRLGSRPIRPHDELDLEGLIDR